MQLLESSGRLLKYCYAIARVVHMGARLFWVVAMVFWFFGITLQFLGSSGRLLRHCYVVAQGVHIGHSGWLL